MSPVQSPPSEADMGNYLWDELVLQANTIEWSFIRELIEDFWPKIVNLLSKIKDIEIVHPTDEPWFHIRRAPYRRDVHIRRTVYPKCGEIDVLRLKRVYLSAEDVDRVLLLAESYSGITHVNWCRWNPNQRHDNEFLSFLQKLSILRAKDGICYNGFLGQAPQDNYDKDPQCQEAYKVMTTPNRKWSDPLTLWFDHMFTTRMEKCKTHEYAHWFGHIISGWPDVLKH